MNLGELAEVQMGYPFRSRLEHDPRGDVAVLQMKDIDEANLLNTDDALRVSLPNRKARHMLRPGDLLFRSRGRSNGAARVPEGIGTAVVSAPMLLVRPHGALPEYLCWYINSQPARAQLETMAEGTSVRMISAEALKALEIPLPSPEVQRHIAGMAELAEREQALLAEIATLRQRHTTHVLMNFAREATP